MTIMFNDVGVIARAHLLKCSHRVDLLFVLIQCGLSHETIEFELVSDGARRWFEEWVLFFFLVQPL